jgi:hypothetical protein
LPNSINLDKMSICIPSNAPDISPSQDMRERKSTTHLVQLEQS